MSTVSRIEKLCAAKGMKMTGPRRVIARVLSSSKGHPDVEEVLKMANMQDSNISIATVYRTVRLFEEVGILERHDFGDGRSRYEENTGRHHDHLVNMETGEVIEFNSLEIEALQRKVASDHGFKLVGHRLELHVIPLGSTAKKL